MGKKNGVCLALALLGLLTALTGCGQETPAQSELFAMDTVMNLTAYGESGQAALEESERQITALEALLSRTEAASEVSRLNAANGDSIPVSPTTAQLLSAAARYADATSGAFDITVAPVVSAWGFTTDSYQVPSQETLDALVPLVDYRQVLVGNAGDGQGDQASLGAGQSIDLGGIAKGYASDCVEEIFRGQGVSSGMISLGGNVFVLGAKPDGSSWRVAVQDPADGDAYVGVLSLADAYAITSGGYQRYFEQDGRLYHHIIDPSTGYPAESGLLSVTVVADANDGRVTSGAPGSGAMCDAFSTALFVLGEERALSFWRSGEYDFDLVLVTDDGRVLVTEGLADRFEGNEESDYAYEIVR